ncbi:hypothetical protein [Lamprobacter modestohalophilus]|uniref:hypothetical protein n=1 Tax=Lamprobacter modestohalophilus TaxID=1064514 RepID=UPI001902C9AE|nr:hypothetical protein [Lamprobacter modestohalophilus]
MTELKLAGNGLLIPPQYLKEIGAEPCVRRIKGGLLIESRHQSLAREQLCDLVARLRIPAEPDAPGEDEIAALVDEVRSQRARHR